MSASERQMGRTETTTHRHIISVSTGPQTTATDRSVWDAFRCRKCQKLMFKATPQLFDGLTSDQRIEIKCACKTMNYHMGTLPLVEQLVVSLRALSDTDREAVIAKARGL